eukprot:GHVN01054071.1.p1 GENE.GHVN01054071.1~~GHVN01054071.1.p1  ORF type:complete len:473 (+),score=23.30 GHVN01054071.1:2097-3515(+)
MIRRLRTEKWLNTIAQSRTQSSRRRSQLNSVEHSGAAFAGIFLDRYEPRKSLTLCGSFHVLGILLLRTPFLRAAFIFQALGAQAAFGPLISIANLFPEKRHHLIALMNIAFCGSMIDWDVMLFLARMTPYTVEEITTVYTILCIALVVAGMLLMEETPYPLTISINYQPKRSSSVVAFEPPKPQSICVNTLNSETRRGSEGGRLRSRSVPKTLSQLSHRLSSHDEPIADRLKLWEKSFTQQLFSRRFLAMLIAHTCVPLRNAGWAVTNSYTWGKMGDDGTLARWFGYLVPGAGIAGGLLTLICQRSGILLELGSAHLLGAVSMLLALSGVLCLQWITLLVNVLSLGILGVSMSLLAATFGFNNFGKLSAVYAASAGFSSMIMQISFESLLKAHPPNFSALYVFFACHAAVSMCLVWWLWRKSLPLRDNLKKTIGQPDLLQHDGGIRTSQHALDAFEELVAKSTERQPNSQAL